MEDGTLAEVCRAAPLNAANDWFPEVAVVFGGLGLAFEADALLVAARSGLDSDLAPAIEFFREVGATAYLAEAESLGATTRSA